MFCILHFLTTTVPIKCFNNIFLQWLLLCTALSSVMAINCFVCDASDNSSPFQCGEWFKRFDDPDLQPRNCSNVQDAKFCIKHAGHFEGGIGAKRFCSSKDLSNHCDYTCSTDGCNDASSLQNTQQLLLISGVLKPAIIAERLNKFW